MQNTWEEITDNKTQKEQLEIQEDEWNSVLPHKLK
jgi:hypothetical protein